MKNTIFKRLLLLCLLGCFAQVSYAQTTAEMMGIPASSDYIKLHDSFQNLFDSNGALIDSTDAKKANKMRRSLRFWDGRAASGNFQDYAQSVLDSWQNDEICWSHEDYLNINANAWKHVPLQTAPTLHSVSSYPGGSGAIMSQWIHPINPNIMFVGGSSGGLWKTTDGGAYWENLTDNDHIPHHGIGAISVNPNNVNEILISMRNERFTQHYNIGVFRTTSNGNNWDLINSIYLPDERSGILDIKRFPDDQTRIIAISANKIFLSTNSGISFTEVASSENCSAITDDGKMPSFQQILIDTYQVDGSGDQVINTVYVSGAEFWRSDDRGNNYSNLNTNLPKACNYTFNSSIDIAEDDPSTLYRLNFYKETGEEVELFYSTDQGTNWTLKETLVSGFSGNARGGITNLLAINDELFFTGAVRIRRLTDSGSFSNTPIGSKNGNDFGNTYYHDDIRDFQKVKVGSQWHLFAATDGGLFRSSDDGQHWDYLTFGLDLSEAFDMDTHSQTDEVYMAYQDMGWSAYNKKTNLWETGLVHADGTQAQGALHKDHYFYLKTQGAVAYVFKDAQKISSTGYNVEFGGSRDYNTGSSADYKNTDHVYASFRNIISLDVVNNSVSHIVNYSEATNENYGYSCRAIANANSNPDVLYTAWETVAGWQDANGAALYLSNLVKGVKDSNGDYNWTNISIHGDLNSPTGDAVWKMPSTIAVHPDDENIVMVGLNNWKSLGPNTGNTSENIYLSMDGGATWEDKSYGLPLRFGVNDLIYQKGTDMRFYVGTDVGVYYFDPDHQEDGYIGKWKCLNLFLPNSLVNSLRIDYCQDKLYAAVLGRGLWEMALMPADGYETIISSSQTWDFYKEMGNDIRIQSGATLTVKGELGMAENTRIYVEKGAKLIVNEGHIYSACGTTWRGIHVEGDNTLAQGSPGTPIQGYVYMNNATIENALRGVRLIGESSSGGFGWGTAGGWIRADNSDFINCRKAAEFWKYEHVNKSRFANCSFESNADYPFSEAPEHITMWGVDGVKIEGSAFSTLPDFNDGLTHRAIFAIDANFSVKADINNTRSSFTGFDKAIDVDNSATSFTLTVDESDFTGNNRAMTLSNVMTPTITRNHINMSSSNGNYPMGMALYNCYRYRIEDNQINGNADYPNPNVPNPKDISPLKEATTGIYINHTSSEEYNEIYRNDISGCFWGMYVHGDHQDSGDGNIGLELLCNDMGTTSELIGSAYPNAWDVYVYGKMSHKQGVFPSTGDDIDDIEKPAGNRFDDAAAFNNEGNFDIANSDFDVQNYFHHSTPITNPDEVNLTEITKSPYDIDFPENNRNQACPVNITNGNTHGFPYSYDDKSTLINGKRSELDYLENNYATTIDNGITAQLLGYLTDFSAPDDQILDYMVAGSPYLSDQVMIGAITRTPAFDQWDLAEILVWNAPLSPTVIQAINQAQPFTPYLYSLATDQSGTSQRTLLDAEIAALKQEIQQIEADYVGHALNETGINNRYQKIVDLTLDETDIRNQQLLLWAYMQQNDLPAVASILSNHSGEEIVAVAALQHTVLSRGDNLAELNSAELSTLHSIATDETHAAYMEARALLKLNNGLTYNDPLPIIYTEPAARKGQTTAPYTGTDLMKIQPNPIQNEAIVKVPLPNKFPTAKLYIYRIDGSLQEVIDLKASVGFTQIQVRHWKAGTYIAELQIDKKSIEQQKFTVIH